MVMMVSLMVMAVVVLLPFLLGAARHVVLRTGRPKWVRRLLAAHAKDVPAGAGATATDELLAFLNANKRVQIEQREEERLIRHDVQDGAPRRTGVDLDAGTAVIRRDSRQGLPGGSGPDRP
ncbi:DUF6191 domain-containing protein [Streptomyces sp. NPDC004284]|uniref:DUF6191 domain-containing protein n=1 Tax=Streptomyces sp. NPDC004284 TaxID=3364695 RepID=UPI00369AA747